MQWGNEWTNPVMDEPSTAKPPLGDTAIPRRPGTGTSACVWERARQGEIRVGEGVRLVGLVGPPPPWDWVGYRERERGTGIGLVAGIGEGGIVAVSAPAPAPHDHHRHQADLHGPTRSLPVNAGRKEGRMYVKEGAQEWFFIQLERGGGVEVLNPTLLYSYAYY